jgi:hypothetical protein
MSAEIPRLRVDLGGFPCLLVLDPPVLEVFKSNDGSSRYHLDLLRVERDDPGRKGRMQVTVKGPGPAGGRRLLQHRFAGDDVAAADAFFAAVESAQTAAPTP